MSVDIATALAARPFYLKLAFGAAMSPALLWHEGYWAIHISLFFFAELHPSSFWRGIPRVRDAPEQLLCLAHHAAENLASGRNVADETDRLAD